ncbi:MAG: bifunctional phosphopantothenoylcysteine decarboxylase/phosphopantothenate--cysteine ligase CoaBC [Acidimicrobiales bacterium]
MPGPAFAGRRVVLGVCGGIAAYKAVEVCRRLVDAGAHVTPVLTGGATRFVGPLTFSALASEPAQLSLWDGPTPIPHTRLGQQADLVVVAPATARLIGAYAAGIPSDLLTSVLLATRAPVLLCPAMHSEMWEHPAVVDNLALLRRRGVHVLDPGEGRLAGGDVGRGRLAEPADIVAGAAAVLGAGPLAGVRAVVTAGGTREPIDAVRYIANRSSGKQGHALAAELIRRGASVTLVTTEAPGAPAGASVVAVETAADMDAAVAAVSEAADVIVMAAAVADFRPDEVATGKLKKADGPPALRLVPTPDILAGLGARHRPGQVLVGFAAETAGGAAACDDAGAGGSGARDRLVAYAAGKLAAKQADLIVANDVGAPGVGFAHDTNAVVIVGRDGVVAETGLVGKDAVAAAVVDAIADLLGRTPVPPPTARPSPEEHP